MVVLLKIKIFEFLKEPNPEDPLNKEAAEVLQNNKRLFEQNVYNARWLYRQCVL